MSDLVVWAAFTPVALLFWFSARQSRTEFGEALCAFALLCLPVSLVLKEIGRVSSSAAELAGWVVLAQFGALLVSEPFTVAANRRYRRQRRRQQHSGY